MDSLELKYIKGYNNKYCINSIGEVFISNYRNTGVMKKLKSRVISGYLALGLEKETVEGKRNQKIHKIHRLVAETFIPNPENKPCVNHRDGNKLNNCKDNLEWCTVAENTQHSYANKLQFTYWTKELGIICINLIENYQYNFADVAKLFNLPSRSLVFSFWKNGYKKFKLNHSNVFIPKHSKKLELPLDYKNYILNIIKDNTVLTNRLNDD